MATPKPRRDVLVDDIDRALAKEFGLERSEGAEPFAGDRPVYWIRPRFRMAEHFDLAPAALVHDPILGTLAIVEVVLPEPKSDSSAAVVSCVQRHVDAAAYVRHLLLRDVARGKRPATTVELVLLTGDANDEEKNTQACITDALRGLLRDTETLYHLGVGVLSHAGEKGYEGRLRRAFPFLLAGTRKWLASGLSRPSQDSAAPIRRVASIELENYRSVSKRRVELGEADVHLVQGANGSGKSSIVESIELASSGRVARLERALEKDYASVIRRQGSADPARVVLEFRPVNGAEKPERFECEVGEKLVSKPLDASVDPSSFRLDQPFMERLISDGPFERSKVFLEAFFPIEEKKSLEKHAEIQKSRDAAVAALAPVIEVLESAKRALDRVAGWRGGATTATNRDFAELLNEWLEKTTLCEITQRELLVRQAVNEAHASGWVAPEGTASFLAAAPVDEGALVSRAERWKTEAERLRSQLASFAPAAAAAVAESPATTLERREVDALNAVGEWLLGADVVGPFGPFGDKLRNVMSGRDYPTYGKMIVGGEGWAAPAARGLDELLAACRGFGPAQSPATWPGQGPCPAYAAAAERQSELLRAGSALEGRLIAHLRAGSDAANEFDGSLQGAVNELLALFTPARWGYADIRMEPQVVEGQSGLALVFSSRSGPVRAELYLNTAQLNLFTVALFLLCSSRVPKQLGLLLFDDPLQNMDELTSTALARGLAKFVRLAKNLQRPMDLIFFFHGAEDLERFRVEMPAAVYRLPWLSLTDENKESPIQAETPAGAAQGTQKLDKLFSARV